MRARVGKLWRRPVRNVEVGALQDTFLISAVAMILIIRLQLWLTHYPQLGGGKLHIAHLLWGGLFMLIAIGLLLSYVGRSLRTPAAIIGGIGFGFFIDELGKFITSDNDYFFQPAAALIYIIFIGLFLLTRAMQSRRGFSEREYLVNAVDALVEAARRDLDEREKRRAIALLERSDPRDPLVVSVRRMLDEIDALPAPEPNVLQRAAFRVRDFYFGLIRKPGFTRAIGWVFTVWAVLLTLQLLSLAIAAGLKIGGVDASLTFGDGHFSFINVASVASSAVTGVLVIAGVIKLRRGTRLEAYELFDKALLVQIFIGQVFAFVESQFAAVFGLGIAILMLVTLRYMMRGERHLARAGGGEEAPPPAAEPAPAGGVARA